MWNEILGVAMVVVMVAASIAWPLDAGVSGHRGFKTILKMFLKKMRR